MAIKIICACGKKFAVKDELAGKKVKCPACQKVLSIPKPKVQEASLDDEWNLGDSAEEDFDDEPAEAPAKSRGGKSSASRGSASRKSSGKGKGKKSKSSNLGLLIGLSAGGGVLVVGLLTWLLWPAAPANNVANNPDASNAATPATVSGDATKNSTPSEDNPVAPSSVQRTVTLDNHTSGVISVAFSPDGARIVSACNINLVKLCDAGTGQETAMLKGHTETVTSVAFSPDGARLASASDDKTVKIWDVSNRNSSTGELPGDRTAGSAPGTRT